MIEVKSGIDFDEMVKASSRWRHDIIGFIKEALRVERISWQQEASLIEWQRLLDVKLKMHHGKPLSSKEAELEYIIGQSNRGGKGVGKDTEVCWKASHFQTGFPNSKIFCTSVNSDHMKQVLWPEMIKWLDGSIIRDLLHVDAEKIYMKLKDKNTSGKTWFMVPKVIKAKTTDRNITSGFSGLHEDFLFFIIDEWAALPDVVMDQIVSTLTLPVNVVSGGFNPTRSGGYAADTHKKEHIAKYWLQQHWSSRESPFCSDVSIQRMEDKYGKSSNEVRIYVDGEFPISSDNNVYPWDWTELAMKRVLTPGFADERVAGLDVGSTGDDSCFTPRHGPCILNQHMKSEPNEYKLFCWVRDLMLHYKIEKVFYDIIGIGHGVGVYLREEFGDEIAIPADVKVTPFDTRFLNRRSECADIIRQNLRVGTIAINPELVMLQHEMSVVEYDDKSGQKKAKEQIISSKALKKILGHSPNRYASLLLSYFEGDNSHRVLEENKDFYNPSDKLYDEWQNGEISGNRSFLEV